MSQVARTDSVLKSNVISPTDRQEMSKMFKPIDILREHNLDIIDLECIYILTDLYCCVRT